MLTAGLFSCQGTNDKKKQPEVVTMTETTVVEADDHLMDSVPVSFRMKTGDSLKLLTIFQQSVSDSEINEYTKKCAHWRLSLADIGKIIAALEPVTASVIHYQYSTLPCEYAGELEWEAKKWKYDINAGSHVSIFNADTSLYFECNKKELEHLFLAGIDLTE